MSEPNAAPKPYRQVFLPDDQLEYGLTVRWNLPLPPPEQRRAWEPVPWEPIAFVTSAPEQLAERFGLSFQHTGDDLDLLRIAVIDLDDGLRIAFKRHRGPDDQTSLEVLPSQLASAEALRRDLAGTLESFHDEALRRVMDGLGLRLDEFSWLLTKDSTSGST